jgi:hypothetical protein
LKNALGFLIAFPYFLFVEGRVLLFSLLKFLWR